MPDNHRMKRKRWKLVALWGLSVVLAIVGFGAHVYRTARADVERSVHESFDPIFDSGFHLDISFERIRFSSESWVILEFHVQVKPRLAVGSLAQWDAKWGLHEWDIIPYYRVHGGVI